MCAQILETSGQKMDLCAKSLKTSIQEDRSVLVTVECPTGTMLIGVTIQLFVHQL